MLRGTEYRRTLVSVGYLLFLGRDVCMVCLKSWSVTIKKLVVVVVLQVVVVLCLVIIDSICSCSLL